MLNLTSRLLLILQFAAFTVWGSITNPAWSMTMGKAKKGGDRWDGQK